MQRSAGTDDQCCPQDPVPPTATGTVTICKTAGPGVTPGDLYSYSVNGGAPISLSAGAVPGNCVTIGPFPAGSEVTIQETVPGPNGATPSGIVVTPPAQAVSIDVPNGKTVVTVLAGADVNVNYTNEAPIGTLTICKEAGVNVTIGTLFQFTIDEGVSHFNLAAGPIGNCSTFGPFPAGTNITVKETIPGPGGALPESITVDPPAAIVSVNVGTGQAVVTIQAGGDVNVTYKNSIIA